MKQVKLIFVLLKRALTNTKNVFFNTIRTFVSLTLVFIPATLSAQNDSINVWINKIDNSSIRGTCHYAWVIEPTKKEVANLIEMGSRVEKKMIKLLTNENKAIVAHYILSNINKETDYKIISFDSLQIKYIYNNLEFIEMKGTMTAEKSEFEKCRAYWLKRSKKKKQV
jgi:hypothetical protein